MDSSERGRMTWLSSEDEGGPDVGMIVGLGNGPYWHERCDRLTQALAEAEAALEFYANTHTWRTATVFACGHHEDSKADRDGGERARQALSTIRAGGGK